MTRTELYKIIAPIVRRVTGVPKVILADQNRPAPTDVAYASIEPMQSLTQRGQAVIRKTGGIRRTVDNDLYTVIMAQCSINFYRDDARSYAVKLMECHKLPSVSATLFKAGVAWNRCDAVNNLTSLQSNNWEQRTQINVYLAYEERVEENINNIEIVEYEIEDEKGDTIMKGTL